MENKKIGELLKSARTDKKLSIDDVSLKTKINTNILKSLEANRLDKLPNKTYVRGFVKTYAKLVGISNDEIIQALDFTYGESTSSPTKPAEIIEDDPAEKQKRDENEDIQDNLKSIASSMINKKFLIGIGVAIILVIAVKSIGAFFSQLSNEQVKIVKEDKPIAVEEAEPTEQEPVISKEDIEKIEKEKAEKEKADKEALAIAKKEKEDKEIAQAEKEKTEVAKKKKEAKAKKEKEAKDIAEAKAKKEKEVKDIAEAKAKKEKEVKEKAEKKEDAKKEEVKVTKKVDLNGKYPKINFYKAPTKMFSIVPDAKENTDTEILPTRFKNAIVAGKQNVYIRAHSGDTWVSYQSDEDKIKRFVLKEGRSVLIKGEKILLFMGNVKVSKIFYNNQLIDTPTKSGVKSLIFPQSLASESELPLFPSYKGIPMKASDYKANMSEE